MAFALATLAITASVLFACTRETTTVQTVIVEREITVEPDVVVQTVVFEREITVKPEIEVQTVVIERKVTSEPNIVVVEREVPTTPQIVVQTVLVEPRRDRRTHGYRRRTRGDSRPDGSRRTRRHRRA